MDNHTYSNEGTLERSESDGDFLCSCCYSLMIQPTTLTCGHNSCRLCLAKWYLTSRKKECPTCRQQWQGHPKVNVTLRNMMSKIYGERVRSKELEIEADPEANRTLDLFEKDMVESSRRQQSSDPKAFCTGIVLTLGAVLVAYLAWYWRNSDQDLLIHRPVASWKAVHVHQWLSELGWASGYADASFTHQIDGNMLLALDQDSIENVLGITNSLHQKALLLALQDLAEHGMKMPSNLWEFKAMRPGMSLALLYGMKDCPRTTMFYMYLSHYEDIFLPFVHLSTPVSEDNATTFSWSQIPTPTTKQYVVFLTNMVFLPYWVIAGFSWSFIGLHFWTALFVLVDCLSLTLLETLSVKNFITHRSFRSCLDPLKQYVKMLLSCAVFVIVWPIVPRIICDFFFYATLYYSPFQLANSFWAQIRQPGPR